MKKYLLILIILMIVGCSSKEVIEPVVEKDCGFPLKYFTSCK